MSRLVAASAAFALVGLSVVTHGATAPKPGVDWPSFRGIRASGVADGFTTATTWNVPKAERVAWKTALPGLGHASPIVWGNRIYLATAISGKTDAGLRPGIYGDIASVNDDTSHTWVLFGIDKKSGKIEFRTTMFSGVPKIKRHTKSTHASSTLATDGSYIVAMLGSEGMYAYDMKGTLVWKKDLGVLDSGYFRDATAQWAFGSSPVIHDGVVIIQADVQKDSFVGAFDVKTGKELWRTPRADVPTWGTPTIHQVGDQTQVLVNGWHHTGAYDFKTGKEIWRLDGGGDIPVPTPFTSNGLIYITNAHGPASPIYAIRDSATGDISLKTGETANAHVAWSVPRDGGYLVTPVLYRDLLYVCKTNGAFSAFDAKTGEKVYQQRLGTGTSAFTASIVAGDGKVYFTSEDGDAYVVKAGREFELLATNQLGDIVMATPAISEGVMYFRTAKSLIAIK